MVAGRYVGMDLFLPNAVVVHSDPGGWWTRPANWASNTAITMTGILAIAYGVWSVSAEREVMKMFSRSHIWCL